jgi:hypothetical protein
VLRAAPVHQVCGGVELFVADAVATLVALAVQVAALGDPLPQTDDGGGVPRIGAGLDEVVEADRQRAGQAGKPAAWTATKALVVTPAASAPRMFFNE